MPRGKLTYQRGDICWINLEPTVGAETRKIRPCLIVQNDIMNQHGLLTIVMPFRPGSKQTPYVINVQATSDNGLDKARFIDAGQIRAVDHSRILEKIGIIEEQYWEQIRIAINIVLGFVN